MSESRGAKRGHEEEHEEHVNHEAWVIPYADVLTLLMALFLVLWALGGSDEEKLHIAAESFRRELGGGSAPFNLGIGSGGAGPLSSGAASVLDGAGPAPIRSDAPEGEAAPPSTVTGQDSIVPVEVVVTPSDENMTELPPTNFEPIEGVDGPGQEAVEMVLGDTLTEVENVVRARAEGTGLIESIGFRREARGLVVTIVTDKVLFSDGRADVQPDGTKILDVVADALKDVPNDVMIEGHTDSRPISTFRFPSNWELSTARATSVLRYLAEQRDFPTDRLSAAGYADTQPVDTGGDASSLARNRRVEIVVLATA